MIAAIALLSECTAAGVELYLDNGRLRYRAQPGAYTEALRQKVAVYKTELIAELASGPVTLDLTREERRQEALPESAKARRFKVTLKSGGVLLHSAPSGLTRREAIELSKDWGEVAECVPAAEGDRVPVPTQLEVRNPVPLDPALVRCADCAHFERMDRPHIGRCARGHGRYWLWDTNKRQCKDFEAAVEGQP